MKYKLFTLCIFISTMLFSQITKTDNGPQVETTDGIIEGFNDSGINHFLGIPYAAPPVGDLRWRAPQAVENWEGVRESKKFGPRAMQHYLFQDMNFRSDGMSEDCLYLNVWTPAKKGDEALPVLVYFYGGGLFTGDGSEYRYDGEQMARNGIVAITVNYRLNVFGFMAHPELTKETKYKASGNYGFLDQTAALKWIRDNISAFGGDPSRVSIAGESAGSVSVCAQMASPLSKDLIAGAIGSSGSIMGTLSAFDLKQGEDLGVEFAKSMGASNLEELRAMPAKQLLEGIKNNQFSWAAFRPIIDGYFFPKSVDEIFEAKEQAQIPLLLGWNSLESGGGSSLGKKEATMENFKAALQEQYPDDWEKIIEVYSGKTEEEILKAAQDLSGDQFTGFSTWKWGNMHGKYSDQKVYQYYFARPRPSDDPNAPKGAVHSAEIEYAMGNLPTNKVYEWTEADYQVSEVFQTIYANFVKKGNPNGLGVPEWIPINEGETPMIMHIDEKTYLKEEANRKRYLVLDSIYK